MEGMSTTKLEGIVDRALRDDAYAERLHREPDTVAAEHGLSPAEAAVLRHMNREQFATARADAGALPAGELSDEALGSVAGGSSFSTLSKMVLGRSIIAAAGGNYRGIASAGCDCCAWKGGIVKGGAVILPAG